MKYLSAALMILAAALVLCFSSGGQVIAGVFVMIAIGTMFWADSGPAVELNLHIGDANTNVTEGEPEPVQMNQE